MKPALQVPLAILVVAALVYIMYSQSQNKTEEGDSGNDQVENVETATDNDGDVDEVEDSPEGDEVVTEEEPIALDALVEDEPEKEQSGTLEPIEQESNPPQKKVAKNQAKRAPLSLRERRRSMFKKIDSGQKDGLVSEKEHDQFFRKAFDFYDKNDDGRLAGYEINQVKRLPRKADANKDGVLTRQEFLDQFERFFEIMDKDASGDLTEKEFVR